MKLFLKFLLSMKLSVANENSDQVNNLIDELKSTNYLLEEEIDLYHKINLRDQADIAEFIKQNWQAILEENLLEFKFGEEIINNTQYELVKFDGYQLTIKFTNQANKHYLKADVLKEFDLFLYNYDELDKVKNYVENNFFLTTDVLNYKDEYLYDYLEANFKERFNEICAQHIVLNDEQNFFDYLDISKTTSDGLTLEFLNSSALKIGLIKE